MFFNRSETSLKEQISRDVYSHRERCCFVFRYHEYYDHKSVKSSASVTGYKLTEYYKSPTSFSSPFSCPSFSMLKFDEKSTSFNCFIQDFETYISKRIDPMLRIHLFISACKGEHAESIEHFVLLDPEQGYTEALRIHMKTLKDTPNLFFPGEVYRFFTQSCKRLRYIRCFIIITNNNWQTIFVQF